MDQEETYKKKTRSMKNLLASWNCAGEVHLVVGASHMAFLRIRSIIESGARPILIADLTSKRDLPQEILNYIDDGVLKLIPRQFSAEDVSELGRAEVDNVVDKVFVALPISQYELKKRIYQVCKRLRVPVNISDSSELSTFSLLSTYSSGDFQFGVSTSGKGCKLASRIRREMVNALPPNIGEICNKVGELREKIYQEDMVELEQKSSDIYSVGEHDDDAVNTSKLNALIKEFNMTQEQRKTTRARWLSQIVEYYPLVQLANISINDLSMAYKEQKTGINSIKTEDSPKKGSISLVGSGPGSVSLLTLGALKEISTADLILADKLVPEQVLELIPKKRTNLFIAKKFPGNAENAQQELLSVGLDALERGEKVVRLKQGDPYIFGRGGEEYNFFADHGYQPTVLPGISSALAAPVLSNVAATHREVADQVLICTGTGRRGVLPNLPDFNKSRTTIFLMALHRIVDLVPNLIQQKNWDPSLPVAVVERASCPDQRVIRTTLEKVANAIEVLGSRPPGLLITGYSCDVITKNSDSSENNPDWIVEEGCDLTHTDDIASYISFAKALEEN